VAVAFEPAERERLTNELLRLGEKLFTTQGLRKTSLAELTEPLGIAKSSFYSFFPAKESLYLELMVRHAADLAPRLRAALSAPVARDALVAVMRTTADLLERDPLYRRLVTHPDELAAVGRRLGAEELDRIRPYVLDPLLDFVARAQAAGDVVRTDPMVVVGVVRTVGYVVMHQEEYGPAYRDVLEQTIESLATGLTRPA
jgi:AcrR family transcriptional regulator